MTTAEMISDFSLSHVHKAGARFDIEKAKWFNQSYVKNRPDEESMKHVDFGDTHYNDDQKNKILKLAKERSHFTHDLQHTIDLFVKPVHVSDVDKAKIAPEFKTVFSDFVNRDIDWSPEAIKQLYLTFVLKKELKWVK